MEMDMKGTNFALYACIAIANKCVFLLLISEILLVLHAIYPETFFIGINFVRLAEAELQYTFYLKV